MGFDHYTTDDFGNAHSSGSLDWSQWVSASRTRNWCKRNPLQDWLDAHGEAAGFERDPEPEPRTDFREFVFAKGHAFEAAVLGLLAKKVEIFHVEAPEWPTQSLDACRQTFDAMVRGEPAIAQGVLRNPNNRTYGAADLLIRSDVLHEMFPDALSRDQAAVGAPGIGLTDRHYRVIDIKFTTLRLDRHWNAGSGQLAYMAQTFVYNEALGRIQGYLPGSSYLLGRSWTGPKGESTSNCFDRLAPVPHDLCTKRGPLSEIVDDAVSWVRRNRNEGGSWHPISGPFMQELQAEPSEADYPWQAATKLIAEQRDDPILAWQVGCDGRAKANDFGVTRWTDPKFCAAVAGVEGIKGGKLDEILRVNRDPGAPIVSPVRIRAERELWGEPGPVEFFVDFETVSDINDDFSKLPERGGQSLIFMIGCGHVEGSDWKFESFVARSLTLSSEAEIIEAWLAHMDTVRRRLGLELERPLVFHWSPAESSGLTNGLRSARSRNRSAPRPGKSRTGSISSGAS